MSIVVWCYNAGREREDLKPAYYGIGSEAIRSRNA